ncbi:MAG: ribonuclease J [Patescibacteria group bacterium]
MITKKTHRIFRTEKPERKHVLKETHQDAVKFVALGGFEEVGRNMSVFEYKNEIVLFDAGLQFPEEDTPGIDFIIPNVEYLEPRKHNIKGLVITHAHYDHMGALPYILGKIGNPTIYTTALTAEIIKKRHGEFPNAPKLDIVIIKNRDTIKLSDNLEATFFGIIHSIPDTVSILLKTPVGNFVYATDVQFDYAEDGSPIGLEEFKWVGKENILGLFLDSTNAEKTGPSISERTVEKNIDEIFKKATGRIIVGVFASLLNRIGEIIKIAEKHNRKVAISGLSMKTNLQIAQNLGYIKTKKGTIISLEEINRYKDDKILILSTGAQGESNASLMKIVNGEHRSVRIKRGDAVIFSSSIIPGNERSVQVLKDNLSRQGAKVYHSTLVDIHASGHATGEELKIIIETVKPKLYIPIHGYYFMRASNASLAQETGIPEKHILLVDNGQIIAFSKHGVEVLEEMIPTYYVMVDGLGVGDVGEIVMRDRKVLSQEGMVVIISTLDRKSGRFLKNPDIISRGFIYLKENKELVEDLRRKIKGIVGKIPKHQQLEPDYIKALIRDQIGQFLYTKTKRRPMVLPVIIQV